MLARFRAANQGAAPCGLNLSPGVRCAFGDVPWLVPLFTFSRAGATTTTRTRGGPGVRRSSRCLGRQGGDRFRALSHTPSRASPIPFWHDVSDSVPECLENHTRLGWLYGEKELLDKRPTESTLTCKGGTERLQCTETEGRGLPPITLFGRLIAPWLVMALSTSPDRRRPEPSKPFQNRLVLSQQRVFAIAHAEKHRSYRSSSSPICHR